MAVYLLSLLLAFWFQIELKRFPLKINRQVYQDYSVLYKTPVSFNDFLQNSTLMPFNKNEDKQINRHIDKLFYLCLPISAYLFEHNFVFMLIIFILCYLSILDICYYLTDINYIAILFLLSIYTLLNLDNGIIAIYLTSFLCCAVFLLLIIPLLNFILKQQGLGIGDVVLFIALSPLFELPQLLLLFMYSSLLGIGYFGVYYLFTHKKMIKLPFIPFISMATVMIY